MKAHLGFKKKGGGGGGKGRKKKGVCVFEPVPDDKQRGKEGVGVGRRGP